MILILIILYALTVLAIILFLFIKVSSLPENAGASHTREHHERWLYHLIHDLWRRGMRSFRELINIIIVTCIKWWIQIVGTINRKLREKFPHLTYLFGDRISPKHHSEVEASDYMKEIRAHQEGLGVRENSNAVPPNSKQQDETNQDGNVK